MKRVQRVHYQNSFYFLSTRRRIVSTRFLFANSVLIFSCTEGIFLWNIIRRKGRARFYLFHWRWYRFWLNKVNGKSPAESVVVIFIKFRIQMYFNYIISNVFRNLHVCDTSTPHNSFTDSVYGSFFACLAFVIFIAM